MAVVGCGGVGLAAINGAKIAGAARIIAIDTVPSKLELARKFGATDAVLASDGDAVAKVVEMTQGGVEYSFECIGMPATVEQCFRMLQPGGTATILGLFPPGVKVAVEGSEFFLEKKLRGSALGSSRIREDIPRLVELYMQGRLNLDDLVSRRIGLDDINEGFEAMKRGEVARSVIVFEALGAHDESGAPHAGGFRQANGLSICYRRLRRAGRPGGGADHGHGRADGRLGRRVLRAARRHAASA